MRHPQVSSKSASEAILHSHMKHSMYLLSDFKEDMRGTFKENQKEKSGLIHAMHDWREKMNKVMR